MCKQNAVKQSIPERRLNRLISKDRRKSVSKSIQRGQRETSLPSLFDYTLKFLNDDMAITKREQDPLIEQIVEDDFMENQSQLNKMIFQN